MKDNNISEAKRYKSKDINRLKIKLKILELLKNSNNYYWINIIFMNDKIRLDDRYRFIKSYIECDYDENVFLIIMEENLSSKQKTELLKVYKDVKYDKGKLDIGLEEKLIIMMECVNHDKESYMFKILTHSKISTKKKIRLKKQYENCKPDSSKELIYCN